MGSVGLTAAIYAPRETALCQGQLLPLYQNMALFSLMGTAFGGDGYSTFGLPDLRGTAPVGTGSA
ncbi:MAG: phage tail protein, partial [Solirubrobacterales bacterium]